MRRKIVTFTAMKRIQTDVLWRQLNWALNIVASRPAAMQWPANNSIIVFSARSAKRQLSSRRGTVFSVWSVPRCFKQEKSRVVGQSPVDNNVSMETEDIVGIRHQATPGEGIVDWEDLVRAVVNCRVCELALALQLLVVMIGKCSVSPITNPNPVYSHSYAWQYLQWQFTWSEQQILSYILWIYDPPTLHQSPVSFQEF
jgi:hypothetical protein